MLGLGLVLGLFSALLGPARTRSPMFDRLQRRNNSHGLKTNLGPDLQNILRYTAKLRSTYDGRLIYKTSHEGSKAFLR